MGVLGNKRAWLHAHIYFERSGDLHRMSRLCLSSKFRYFLSPQKRRRSDFADAQAYLCLRFWRLKCKILLVGVRIIGNFSHLLPT